MARFLGGFVVATLLWGGAVGFAVFQQGWGPPLDEDEVLEDEPVEIAVAEGEDPTPARRRRGRGRARRGRTGSAREAPTSRVPTGEATTGDDLREGEARSIDMGGSGGEQRLSGGQIERGFDSAMPRIRRCFILAPGDAPITGRLVFGLRVAGTGRVAAVNLSGPAALTTGEPGDCLRSAARGIAFDSFDGPEMVLRYPITLE